MPDLSYILEGIDPHVVDRARKVKAVICDVDGVLTNGGIIYDDNGKEFKVFNVKDGQIISHLKRNGIAVGVITGRESDVVKYRCNELKLDFHHHGIKDKLKTYRAILQNYGWEASETAYLGDDLIDIAVLRECGLAITPADAPPYVQHFAHHVTRQNGGRGVLREAGDIILTAQDKMKAIIEEL
ncbi:KdsC family phosphatase [Roseivirga sp. BDSF3-8]|uniref:KdsC family phosphatase n=1 Tax=Roseivirga sp. BDSF3-8 TaxID=3241598 RepID=UPI003531A91C